MTEPEIPNYKVSWQVVDAWTCKPPCEHIDRPYCHVQCPYFYECYPNEDETDDEVWP